LQCRIVEKEGERVKMKFKANRLVLVLFSEVIALCLIMSFRFVNIETVIMLLIFNFLFISLIFQLNGTPNRKLGMLALGNIIGLFWNFIFHLFTVVGMEYFGEIFGAFYTIFYPLLNLMWIVSFWSLSLAALPNPQNTQAEAKP
jgi:bacteriorhodopsin